MVEIELSGKRSDGPCLARDERCRRPRGKVDEGNEPFIGCVASDFPENEAGLLSVLAHLERDGLFEAIVGERGFGADLFGQRCRRD